MKHTLLSQDRTIDLKFPMYVDSDIGLSNDVRGRYSLLDQPQQSKKQQGYYNYPVHDIVQDHEIEQEMDDDVQSDDGIMWNAKSTCFNDLSDVFNKVQNLGFKECSHNREIIWRVKFNKQYTRVGRFKECYDSSSSSRENAFQDFGFETR